MGKQEKCCKNCLENISRLSSVYNYYFFGHAMQTKFFVCGFVCELQVLEDLVQNLLIFALTNQLWIKLGSSTMRAVVCLCMWVTIQHLHIERGKLFLSLLRSVEHKTWYFSDNDVPIKYIYSVAFPVTLSDGLTQASSSAPSSCLLAPPSAGWERALEEQNQNNLRGADKDSFNGWGAGKQNK